MQMCKYPICTCASVSYCDFNQLTECYLLCLHRLATVCVRMLPQLSVYHLPALSVGPTPSDQHVSNDHTFPETRACSMVVEATSCAPNLVHQGHPYAFKYVFECNQYVPTHVQTRAFRHKIPAQQHPKHDMSHVACELNISTSWLTLLPTPHTGARPSLQAQAV